MKTAILTIDDRVWALPYWDKVVKNTAKHELAGICLIKSKNKSNWAFKTFGLLDCARLYIHSLITLFRNRKLSWRSLSNNILFSNTVNSHEVEKWLRKNKIDLAFIMVEEKIKLSILSKIRFGTINKHASLLPSNRGLYPYIWAKINKQGIGFTIHKVNSEIDDGKSLVQVVYNHNFSMLRFYIDVHNEAPYLYNRAVDNLIKKDFVLNNLEASYNSLPKKEDVVEFRKLGGSISKWRDLFYVP